jgi:hypothetical protein
MPAIQINRNKYTWGRNDRCRLQTIFVPTCMLRFFGARTFGRGVSYSNFCVGHEDSI